MAKTSVVVGTRYESSFPAGPNVVPTTPLVNDFMGALSLRKGFYFRTLAVAKAESRPPILRFGCQLDYPKMPEQPVGLRRHPAPFRARHFGKFANFSRNSRSSGLQVPDFEVRTDQCLRGTRRAFETRVALACKSRVLRA